MDSDQRGRIWIPVGILGAVGLGIALVPLRSLTSASNLAFAFVAFVIVVAEFGGRVAGLVAAVVSAMSLNFFLTEPYLSLNIDKPADIVALGAMVACGLIAAAFGARRQRSSEAASRVRDDLEALRRVIKRLKDGGGPAATLEELRRAFGLGRVVLRGPDDRIIAAAPPGAEARAAVELDPETLFALERSHYRFGDRGVRLPEDGGYLVVATESGMAVMHLWEADAHGFDEDAREALAIAASVVGVALVRK